ncbi:hypothetical protein LTR94_031012, partial [Friedmanniomyces endolithicus]
PHGPARFLDRISRAARVPVAGRRRGAPPRSAAVRVALHFVVAAARCAAADRRSRRPAGPPAGRIGQGGTPRHPQDARLLALPLGGGTGRRDPLCRVVRAGPSHRARQCRLLRQPLRIDALVDPDPGDIATLERRRTDAGAGRGAHRCARRRPGRGGVDDLLRQHLQPSARQGRRDAEGDAAQVLEEHARNRVGAAVAGDGSGAG